jgi:DNA-binding PadR family transcriptional regulator
MGSESKSLTPTSYALLGQLALRPWSVYEMTRNVGRTLHWFWPRAESVLYAEIKRLDELGLARTRRAPGRRGRPQTIYAISAKGKRVLADWLRSSPGPFLLHFEALLRVHLSPYGTKEDLLRALGAARGDAEALLRQAIVIGTEFAERRHQFQQQVHVRAILFDYLWNFGLGMYLWADRSIDRIEGWPDLRHRPRLEREAIALITRSLASAPPLPVEDAPG